MLFQRRQTPYLSIPSVVFTSGLLVAVGGSERVHLLVIKYRCRLETDRVISIGSHADSQVKFATALLMCFVAALPRWSAGRFSTHQLS